MAEAWRRKVATDAANDAADDAEAAELAWRGEEGGGDPTTPNASADSSSSSLAAASQRRSSLFRGVRKSVAASTGLHGVFSKGTKLGDRPGSPDGDGGGEGEAAKAHAVVPAVSKADQKAAAKAAAAAALRRQRHADAAQLEAERLALYRDAAYQADACRALPQTQVATAPLSSRTHDSCNQMRKYLPQGAISLVTNFASSLLLF
jgi:hypothetical protein